MFNNSNKYNSNNSNSNNNNNNISAFFLLLLVWHYIADRRDGRTEWYWNIQCEYQGQGGLFDHLVICKYISSIHFLSSSQWICCLFHLIVFVTQNNWNHYIDHHDMHACNVLHCIVLYCILLYCIVLYALYCMHACKHIQFMYLHMY